MNTSMIRYIIGYLLKTEGILLLLPCIIAAYFHETTGFYFLGIAALCFFLGLLLNIRKPESTVFYLKEGCVATSLCWIVLSIFGCLPFYISGQIPSFTDALFETISGFTTTGASILSEVESLDKCMLLWRSFTHWIGGMGVLVFILAIIPLSGGSNINLMKAESPGPSVGKLVPKMMSTARILYLIYFGMTILEMILLLVGKMPLFDSVCTAFGTAGTGGFGIKNDSIAGYSIYLQWVITIFMILFGVNFNAYYYIIFRQFKKAAAIEEVRYYFGIIIASSAFIACNIVNTVGSIGKAITDASFQVASIITTTGFSTVDFNEWSSSCKTILVLLMFVGACAGSTGGGIKVSRFIILIKSVFKEITTYLHPKSVKKIKMDGKPVEHEVVRAVNVYYITFTLVFVASMFIVSLEGYDLVTTFTSVAATINNIGPGLELVGPSANFGFFNIISKYVLMLDMLAGRLELFPLLILFQPGLWKETFIINRRKKALKKRK
jgi:trk system potassium uptake protein TrkH